MTGDSGQNGSKQASVPQMYSAVLLHVKSHNLTLVLN